MKDCAALVVIKKERKTKKSQSKYINKCVMAKGGDFEREISKTFSVWLTGKEKPYQYWRMPGSGGLATIHEEMKGLSGDIRALTPEAEFLTDCFSIECKTGYPRCSFWQTFKKIKGYDLKDFWIQCCHDAFRADKRPMLIYRKKGQRKIVGFQTSDVYDFDLLFKMDLPSIKVRFVNEIELVNQELIDKFKIDQKFMLSLPDAVFYDFEDFFDILGPPDIKRFMRFRNAGIENFR